MPRPLDDIDLRHLAKVIESSDDAIVSKDLNGIVRTWNRAAEQMFGYSSAEMIGQSIRIIIPNERQDEEDSVLARIRHGESVGHFETIRRKKDGTLVPISLTVSPIHDDHGVVVGASKVARDITERTRLLAAAREQALIAERLSAVGATVASSLDQGTIVQQVTDLATVLTHADVGAFFYNAVEPLSGKPFTLCTISGASKKAFDQLRLQPRAKEFISSIFRGRDVIRLEDITLDSRYGTHASNHDLPLGHLPVRGYLAVPVRNGSGEVLGGLFFGHSQAGAFAEQHELLAEGIAGWASLALDNSRLFAAVCEADRLKDEFLAVLSHELRTPLNAILGYARLLRGGIVAGEKAERGLEALERNARSLTQIVDEVLDMSRIVSGKLRLDVEPVELQFIIHNAITTVQPAADAKGLRLHVSVDPLAGTVSGDPDRLQQVIWNLLSNAVKFTPRHGRVQIRLERSESAVEIVISDTGIGISPEFLPHVFERFRQADAGTTRQTGGLGLGLSIVRHIVEMHGGSVLASSDGEGCGSTFRVRLPLPTAESEDRLESGPQPRAERMLSLAALGDLHGIRVMAVDDENDALVLLRMVLETAGAAVTTLSSPVEALEQLIAAKPHVLLVDLGMPEMDGFDFILRVRSSSDESVRDVPAAALTAFARSEDRTRALQSGFEMHLAKPVDPEELVASVATLAKRSRVSIVPSPAT